MIDPPSTRTSTQVTGRASNITFQQSGGDVSSLVVDGSSILPLSDVKQLRFSDGQDLSYRSGQISTNDGTILASDVERLYFHDGLRFYQFDSNKVNPLPGPGALYLNPTFGVALYSTSSDFNSRLDAVLALLGTDTDLEIVETSAPATPPTIVNTESPEPITSDMTPEPISNTPSVISTEFKVTLEPSKVTTSTDNPDTDPPTTDSPDEDPPTIDSPDEDESSDSSSEDSSCVETESSDVSTRNKEDDSYSCDEESSQSKSKSRNTKIDDVSDSCTCSETSALSDSSVSNESLTKSRRTRQSKGKSPHHHHSHLHGDASKRTRNTTRFDKSSSSRDSTIDSDITTTGSDTNDLNTKSSATEDKLSKTKKNRRREQRRSSYRHHHHHSGESDSRSTDGVQTNKKRCPAGHSRVKSNRSGGHHHHHSHSHRRTSKPNVTSDVGRTSTRDRSIQSDSTKSDGHSTNRGTKSSVTEDKSTKSKRVSQSERRHSTHRHSGEPTKERSSVGRQEDDTKSNKKHCPAGHFRVKTKTSIRRRHHHNHTHMDLKSRTPHSHRSVHDNTSLRHDHTHLGRDSTIKSMSHSDTGVRDEDMSRSSKTSSKTSQDSDRTETSDSHVHTSRSRRLASEAESPCYGMRCYAISQAFSLFDSPRRFVRQQQRDPESLDLNLDSTTLNFQLVVDSEFGSISLMHEGQQLINLTDSEGILLTDLQSFSFIDKNLIVTDKDGREIVKFDDVQVLFIFNGTHVGRSEGPVETTRALNGKLYVSDEQAFLSSSEELNNLIDEQLQRVFPDTSRILVEFETLANGDELLSIDETNVLTLNSAEVTEVPEQSFIQYANNTVYIQDTVQGRLVNMYPGISQLFVLNGIQPGLVRYNEVITNELPGEGTLYIHRPSATGLYSRHVPINNAITQRINSLNTPDDGFEFSIQFEPQPDGETPFVTVVVDDVPLIQLNPANTDEQSILPEQVIIYRNQTVIVLMGDIVLNDFKNVEELVYFDGRDLITFKESAPNALPGGGQIFVSEKQGFYSVAMVLNNMIIEALLAVEPSTPDPLSTTATPSSTVPPQTTSVYYPTMSTEAPSEGTRSHGRSTSSPGKERKTPSPGASTKKHRGGSTPSKPGLTPNSSRRKPSRTPDGSKVQNGSSEVVGERSRTNRPDGSSFAKSPYYYIPRRSRPKSHRHCKGESSNSSSTNTSVNVDDKSSDSSRYTREGVRGHGRHVHGQQKQSTRKHASPSSLTPSRQPSRKPSSPSSDSITPLHFDRSSVVGDGSRSQKKDKSSSKSVNIQERKSSSVSQQ